MEELCAPNIVVLQYSDNESTQLTQNVSSEYDLICKLLLYLTIFNKIILNL